MPQRFDGIEPRGFARRDVAENNTDGGGKGKTEEHDRGLEDEGHLQQSGQGSGSDQPQGNADQPAEGGEHDGLAS